MSFRRLLGGRISSFDLCTQEKSLHFTLSATYLLSSFLIQVFIRFVTSYQNGCAPPLTCLCQTSETIVQSAWHSCATTVAQSCQRRGTSMPKVWHEQSIPSAPRPLCFLCPPNRAIVKYKDYTTFPNSKSVNTYFTSILSVPSMPQWKYSTTCRKRVAYPCLPRKYITLEGFCKNTVCPPSILTKGLFIK